LSRYIEPDAQWLNKYNEPWSMERLVRMETQMTVHTGPCGGTHGLFALSSARNGYVEVHGRPTGAWLEADLKIKQYIEIARSLQNHDGTFSAQYSAGPGFSNDYAKRLETTGHQLEWLMLGLPQDRLNEPWVRKAVSALSKDIFDNRSVPVDTGPLFHALDGLVLYKERMQPKSAPPPAEASTNTLRGMSRLPCDSYVATASTSPARLTSTTCSPF
jgi:hypothetical protein